ncbi:hypothetical protein OROHE_019478 [Orobanche hederae]
MILVIFAVATLHQKTSHHNVLLATYPGSVSSEVQTNKCAKTSTELVLRKSSTHVLEGILSKIIVRKRRGNINTFGKPLKARNKVGCKGRKVLTGAYLQVESSKRALRIGDGPSNVNAEVSDLEVEVTRVEREIAAVRGGQESSRICSALHIETRVTTIKVRVAAVKKELAAFKRQ